MSAAHFKTALVLSGGAARAMAHLGVLEALERAGYPPRMIVGTSMGAIIGALYAIHGSARIVSQLMLEFVASDLFRNALGAATDEPEPTAARAPFERFIQHAKKGFLLTRSISSMSLVSHGKYLRIISELIPERNIESLSIPFAAVATDLVRGEEVVLTGGSLLRAVQASAAIPGVLPPIAYQNRYLIDGGWVDNTPVEPALALGAHFTIAVDASWDVSELQPPPDSALELAYRGCDITRMALNRLRRARADVLLIPAVGHVRWSDFSRSRDCVAAGREVLMANLGRIRQRSLVRRLLSLGGWIHPPRPHPPATGAPVILHPASISRADSIPPALL